MQHIPENLNPSDKTIDKQSPHTRGSCESNSDNNTGNLANPSHNLIQRVARQLLPFLRAEMILLYLAALALVLQMLQSSSDANSSLKLMQVYDFSLTSDFEPDDQEVSITTFLPQQNFRQHVLDESYLEESRSEISILPSGRSIQWTVPVTSKQVKYRSRLMTQALHYDLDPNLQIPSAYSEATPNQYLNETEVIQVSHPEIAQLWESIAPENTLNVRDVLSRIFNYTYRSLETVDFKGTTDALTALRLGIASCNGKSRLFVALARLNNLPSRLVGGIILEPGKKRISHQWVEVYIDGHWVPFGPTNGHFASLPAHYLQLYVGDQALIRHTSNINFDYHFDIIERNVSPLFYAQHEQLNIAQSKLTQALSELNLSSNIIGIVLLFPVCALMITFLRNVIGLKTFGIFMPMLIAAACYHTGLLWGASSFLALLTLSSGIYWLCERMQLLKTARLSIVISSVIALLLLALIFAPSEARVELGALAAFPVVIIGFIAERINQSLNDSDWRDTAITGAGTVITVLICYLLFQSLLLKSLFAMHPVSFLFVFAALIYLGKWSGIRISENLRFKTLLMKDPEQVLGINRRNREIVYPHNDKRLLKLAADKLASKQALKAYGIATPETLASIRHHGQLSSFEEQLKKLNSFALKPNNGCQGNGILIISGRNGDAWLSASGKTWSWEQIEQHIGDILSGVYSQSGQTDSAYLEPLIKQHELIETLSPFGLADIRLIVAKGEVVSAMLRIPTTASSGKANLHQGAVGVAINIFRGKTFAARYRQSTIYQHPDTQISLVDQAIPFWPQILELAERCYLAVPLGYLGVDICIDQQAGPLVLEVNGRPGLEIQNINQEGMAQALSNRLEKEPEYAR